MSNKLLMNHKKEFLLFGGLFAIILLIMAFMGTAYGLRMLVEAACYAIIAFGLTIQWGYAGLFNAGIMGFMAMGAFVTMLFSFPVNEQFWSSGLAGDLGSVLLKLIIGIVLIVGSIKITRFGVPKKAQQAVTLVLIGVVYLVYMNALAPVADSIEKEVGFIGGFGLPSWLGWVVGGIAAGLIAYFVGHICLGLRSDYLAIATLGISEIIKAFLKNADWLTNGTLTVSPLPWPTPGAADLGFIMARASYLSLTALVIALIFFLLTRAYNAPWGRMLRAIRDNEVSSLAMGKDVNKRRLEVFVFGSFLMGVGGAILATFNGLFDPNGYIPLNHTFLIWVMVILGGAGNNLGTLFGAVFVYIIWTMSEPAALFVFDIIRNIGDSVGWEAPQDLDSRALQARVFVIGLTISLVLRYAPKGVIPEKVARHG
ncbi:branched-chain amino acid ABC transporter permease [Reinekea marinisedimentorum]|uniref:Branched-chain amino acid transport system permease protein n=1 Tax=Reinekea marinisedimentorum TaxID=230495 RepID=A0A4V2UJT4_9GAMM|nr:branched-chain amino acid ABC transporter permease [Reinekea marinisedimentorum]TCS41401.1 branched-chain amino acid transport system permease protein [Reinekea marinisedimentorum]